MTGSVARGTADEHSDVEVNLWANRIPHAADRRDWFASLGCEDIVVDRERTEDGTVWSHACLRGVVVEVGWQEIGAVDQEIEALLRGDVTDHHALTKAWVLESAIPLRSGGAIGHWQSHLACYPDVLSAALIRDAAREWLFPHVLDGRWSIALRQKRFSCAQEICRDLERVFRILFAVNRRWEPDWKWLRSVTGDLAELPADFHQRVDRALTLEDLHDSVEHTLQLAFDALALASTRCDVRAAAANVRRSLDAHAR